MLFTSIQFLLFAPTIVVAFYLIPDRHRWLLLLGASYFFYCCWEPIYLPLLLFSTLVDYFCGLKMGRLDTKSERKPFLILSLLTNLGLLGVIKYSAFFCEQINELLGRFGQGPVVSQFSLVLPLGISFYTLQTLSYSLDVYNGRKEPEHHLGHFALYVVFFPQLVAGPIERAGRLLPQLKELHKPFQESHVVAGLRLVLWGFFKKLVIADRLALYVDVVFKSPEAATGPQLALAAYFFFFQLYCDFSAYSDIAIGLAKTMGVGLSKNFDRPYLAVSVSDFWRRWHITLSTWFRDYLYIPLGGNRAAVGRNILLVFLISGLWHGANTTFLVWGAINGLGVLAERRFQGQALSVPKFLRIVLTFHLMVLAFVFFRSPSLHSAKSFLAGLLSPERWSHGRLVLDFFGRYELALALVFLVLLWVVEHICSEPSLRRVWTKAYSTVRWAVYYLAIYTILLLGVFEESPFIYFQF